MIHINFICKLEHQFDGWFKNHEMLEGQLQQNQIACPVCNSVNVSKELCTPSITTSKQKKRNQQDKLKRDNLRALDKILAQKEHKKSPQALQAIDDVKKQLQQYVHDNFENVGDSFATKAIQMHKDQIEKQAIYGTASSKDVIKMKELDVPLVNIDWMDTSTSKKQNN